jgi:adenosylcobinamide-GDP ribazoletransferase
MRKELQIFFTTLMFMTRIPVPRETRHDPEYLQQGAKYFPLIGWIVGAGCALAFLAFSRFISEDIGLLASMITGIFLTGALHEDGFADCCDAFGGGWTKEKILAIMKDSRLGSFGVIGLLCILAAKFLLLREIPGYSPNLLHPSSNIFVNDRFFILVLIAAHGLSRLMPLGLMQFSTYVRDPENSKSRLNAGRKLDGLQLLIALFFGLVPFAFLPPVYLLAITGPAYLTFELHKYFTRWIGGYTGDCLGAVQQGSEIAFYLCVLIVWKFLA